MTSGTSQPNCSASSSPIVFLPSIRYGSFRVEVSNQPVASRALPHQLAAVVDQPVDAIDVRAFERDLREIDLRRVLRTEDRGADAAAAGVSGERRARIAVGRHRHVLDAERLRHRHRHHQAARLERAGRQPAFVLDDDFAAAEFLRELRQRDQRRRVLAEADDVLGLANGQQLAPLPQAVRALLSARPWSAPFSRPRRS